MLLLLGHCASLGDQAKMPLVGLSVAPVGADTISNLKIFVGASTAVARLVNEMLVSSLMVRLVLFRLLSTGATFTSLTVMVNVWVELILGVPLSLAQRVPVQF